MNTPASRQIDTPQARTMPPVVRATIVIGTVVALIASVGAPFKWY